MEKSLRDVTWWQFRSKLERRLIILAAVVALLAFILLITVIIMASSKSTVCTNPSCIQASARLLSSIDPSEKPCNDFYKYACGKLVVDSKFDNRSFEISELVNKAEKQFEALFTEKVSPEETKPKQNLKLLYRKCMDVTEIDAKGFDDVREVLEGIGGWPVLSDYSKFDESAFNWMNMIVKLRRAGLSYQSFIVFDKENINGSHYLRLLPNSLMQEELIELKQERTKLLIDIAEAYGAEKGLANYDMKQVGDFIVELNKVATMHTPKYVPAEKLKLETIEEIERISPGVQWLEFLNKIFYPGSLQRDELVAFNLTLYMKDLHLLLTKTPKRVQANYMIWSALYQIKHLQPKEIRDFHEEFNKIEMKAMNITRKTISRSHTCMKIVKNYMHGVAETYYAEKYAPKKTRDTIHFLIDQIKGELKEVITSTEVMDEETKKAGIHRLDTIKEFIGGADYNVGQLNLTYAYIDLDEESNLIKAFNLMSKSGLDFFYTNFNNIETIFALRLLSMAKTVNAYYAPNNFIVIPAALLQNAFYNDDVPDYLMYATLGHILGHEMSHALTHFDTDSENEADYWWSNSSIEEYSKRSECLIDLYEGYTTEIYNVTLNGSMSLNENVADMLGISVAYRAFQKYSEDFRTLPGLEDFSREQLFWLSTIRFYCDPREEDLVSKGSEEYNIHAISSFRVFATMGNSEDFNRDFNCGVGEPMNFEDKCEIF